MYENKMEKIMEDCEMSDTQLEQVAGGRREYYYRPAYLDETDENGNTVKVKGYKFEFRDSISGSKSATHFMEEKDFQKYREAHQEWDFQYGSSSVK